MSCVRFFIEQATHTLKSGLSLYWDGLKFMCCGMVTAYWLQSGSSLYETTLPGFTSSHTP